MIGYLILLFVAAFLVRWVLEGIQGGRARLPAGDSHEVARLRAEVDVLTAEVQRLADEQSFMVRLLSERGTDEPPRRLGHGGEPDQIPNEEKP